MRSHISWSDILALWGPMNRPPWLNTHSTSANVQGVQKTLSNNNFKQANCLLSLTKRHKVPTSEPSTISCTYATAKGLILTRTSQFFILSTGYYPKPSKSRKFSRLLCQDQDWDQDFYLKTKTKTLGLKTKTLFFILEAPRDQDFGLEDYITG